MSTGPASKQQISFYRKLYLAYLISQDSHNLLSLHKHTGMPRRTIQDTLKNIQDIGITVIFVQETGGRNNQGYYELTDWGPIRSDWIAEYLSQIESELGLTSTGQD